MVRRFRCAKEATMDSAVLSKPKFDVYQAITEKIIAAIEAGAPEYHMPWHRSQASVARPVNAVTGKPYRGVNVLSLWADAMFRDYKSGFWATYRQWKSLGAQVRKDSRGALIVFFKKEVIEEGASLPGSEADTEDEGEGPKSRLIARASWVFNADQVEGWTPPQVPAPDKAEVLANVEAFVAATQARIKHGGDHCCYSPLSDLIQMVEREYFVDTKWSTATEAYYATLLHELIHWTGHASRLNRQLRNRFGDDFYAMEELIAELGAAFLCADLGIANEPREDHAAYISAWLYVLKRDRKALFAAGSKAGAGADYLHALRGRSERVEHSSP